MIPSESTIVVIIVELTFCHLNFGSGANVQESEGENLEF